MTKELLEQYLDIQNEIIELKSRINKIRKQSEIVSDVVQNGYKRHAVICGVDVKRKNKLELLERTLRERRDNLLDIQILIESWISSISRSDIRQIFEYRYIDGMNWIQVQVAMRI